MFHCVFPWLTRNAWSEMTSFNRWLWVSLVIARLWRRRQVTEQDSAAGAAMTWRQRLVLVDWNQVLLIVLRKIGNWNFFPLWMYFILTGDRVSCSSLDHPGVYTFGGWRAGTESYSGSTELLIIIFMDELWLSSMNYCNSWKRVLNYGLIFLIGRQNVRFGHWQYKCSCHLMNVTSFWTFCQVLWSWIWSPVLMAVFIIPCVAEDYYSTTFSRLVLEIFKASSYWKRDVYNSLWIESVRNEFLFTDWCHNRPWDSSDCLEI